MSNLGEALDPRRRANEKRVNFVGCDFH
jgi:hypothetical protein